MNSSCIDADSTVNNGAKSLLKPFVQFLKDIAMTRWTTIIRDVVILLVIHIIVQNLSLMAYNEWNLTLATIRALTILLLIVLYTVFGCLAKVNIFRYLLTVTIGYFLAIIPFYFLIFPTNKISSVLYRELFVVNLSFGIGGALAFLYTKKISKANNQNLVNLKSSSEDTSTNTSNLSNTEDFSKEIVQSSGETALSVNQNKVSLNSSPPPQSVKRKSILEPKIADELISIDGTDIGKRILQIKRNLQKKSTNELCQIFYNQNRDEWTREAFIAMHDILKDRNASGTNELTCSHCGANSFEYDNYYKERKCTHCGHTEKDVRLILEATGKILGDRNQVGTNELTCSHCGANSFEYDSYYNEYTCKQCGYIEKNHMEMNNHNIFPLQTESKDLDSDIRYVESSMPPIDVEDTERAVKAEVSFPELYTNGIGMNFVLIPAGSFMMGSHISPEEVGLKYGGKIHWHEGEYPQHEVRISQPFYLQSTAVTQGQWKKVMVDNRSEFKECGDDCPVEKVWWYEAQDFIKKLNEMEGTNKYRLPSEAEWEYACRAGTTTNFSFGDDASKLAEYAWYSDNSEERTHPVGTKKPNTWGLCDMHGNVWEWLEDDWHGTYQKTPYRAPLPLDGSAWVEKSRGADRVIRGGGWGDGAGLCRSAIRFGLKPDYRNVDVGFRLARSVPQEASLMREMEKSLERANNLRKFSKKTKSQNDLNSDNRYVETSLPPIDVEDTERAVKAEVSFPELYTNGIGMDFVLIPAGSFMMGSHISPEEVVRKYGGEANLFKSEHPQHKVTISEPFYLHYLQATAVTQGQWEKVIGKNPSKFKKRGDDCPVETVSWKDIQQFIDKLNGMEGSDKVRYRLPTEAEWEYACRAGTTTDFFFGDDASKLAEYAWYDDNSEERTHPVGTKKPNTWGLCDMHGNVWEWVEDDWHGDYVGAPCDGSAWIDEPRGGNHVIRGGSCGNDAQSCRAAFRGTVPPDVRLNILGFRLARSVALHT